MIRTTFFTSADQRYEMFVLPYIASALFHNPDARVEVCLDDVDTFQRSNEDALEMLSEHFGDGRFLLRHAQFEDVPPHSVRFLETPEEITEFTYIGDIDILILEAITDTHIDRMTRLGLPYSNQVRTGRKALSGLHFTRSKAYYPVTVPTDADPSHDEELLHSMVTARGWGVPPEGYLRPGVHGYHMSLNRTPLPHAAHGKLFDWGLAKSAAHFNAYRALARNPVWQRLLPHFDNQYRLLLTLLDIGLGYYFPELQHCRDLQVGSLLKNPDLIRTIVKNNAPSPAPMARKAQDAKRMASMAKELKLDVEQAKQGLKALLDSLVAARLRAAEAERRLVVAEKDAEHQRELAAERTRTSTLERENEVLRKRVRELSEVSELLGKARTQGTDLQSRLSAAAHSRKSLRSELRKRGRLVARLRSELHAARELAANLRRRVRALEQDARTLRFESARSKAIRKQNRLLEGLLERLNDGLHAVVASRRWRWGGALTLPRRLLSRSKPPSAPDAMLELLAEYRRNRPLDADVGGDAA